MFGHPIGHWILLLALVVTWGSSFALTKIAITSITAEAVIAARIILACSVLVGLIILTRRRLPMSLRPWLFFFVMAIIGNCLPFWLITWGQQQVDSGLAGILMAVMPLVTLVLAHLFVKEEQLSAVKLGGFALGFMGVVMLMGPDTIFGLGGNWSAFLAQLAIVGGAVCYAINTIIAQRCAVGDNVVAAAGTTIAASFLLLPVGAGQTVPEFNEWDMPAVLALLTLGVVSTGLAPVLYFRLIRLAGPTYLSLISYLIPAWAVLVGVMFLGETLRYEALAAMMLILGGVAVSQRPAAAKPKRRVIATEID